MCCIQKSLPFPAPINDFQRIENTKFAIDKGSPLLAIAFAALALVSLGVCLYLGCSPGFASQTRLLAGIGFGGISLIAFFASLLHVLPCMKECRYTAYGMYEVQQNVSNNN